MLEHWNERVARVYKDLIESDNGEFKVDRLMSLHYDDFCTIEAIMWLGRDARPKNQTEAVSDFIDFVAHAFSLSPRGTTKVSRNAAEYVAYKSPLVKYLKKGKALLDGSAEYYQEQGEY